MRDPQPDREERQVADKNAPELPVHRLEVSEEVDGLAESLVIGIPIPAKAALDAYHISAAAVHGVEYLLTWNCRHIANAALRHRIERICRDMGYEPPVICTPQELMEINDVT